MNRYSEKITKFLERTFPELGSVHQLEFRNVFGAVGGYINGRIFISCGTFGVALRLPPDILCLLFQEKGVKHLKYFPTGHTNQEYAVFPKRILDENSRCH